MNRMPSCDSDNSNEDTDFNSTMSSTCSDNSKPIMVRNPFYYKHSSPEPLETDLSTFCDSGDALDNSAMSCLESFEESKVQVKINAVVLKFSPSQSGNSDAPIESIKHSPGSSSCQNIQGEFLKKERSDEIDEEEHENPIDSQSNVKEERQSQSDSHGEIDGRTEDDSEEKEHILPVKMELGAPTKKDSEQLNITETDNENNRNFRSERVMKNDEEILAEMPRIFVKSRAELFPENFRSLPSTRESSQVGFGDAEAQRMTGVAGLREESTTHSPVSPDLVRPSDLLVRRKIRAELKEEADGSSIADSDERTTLIERLTSPSSNDETIIDASQHSAASIAESDNSISSRASTEASIPTNLEDPPIILSPGNKFYPRKPFSPEEDKAIVDAVISCRKTLGFQPHNMWQDLAALPALRGRTAKSICNRFTRYLESRCPYYITDPTVYEWLISSNLEKQEAQHHSNDNVDDEDDGFEESRSTINYNQ